MKKLNQIILVALIICFTYSQKSFSHAISCEQEIQNYFKQNLSENNSISIDQIEALTDNYLTDLISESVDMSANRANALKMLSNANKYLDGESDEYFFYEVITDGPMFLYVIQANKDCSDINSVFYGYPL